MKRVVILGVCVIAGLAWGETPFGAAMAPARLPPASSAVWGYTGVPAIGVGFRQGLGAVELDATAAFDYFDTTFAGTLDLRLGDLGSGRLGLSPLVGLGFAWDPGATYADADNFSYSAVRVKLGAIASWALGERLAALGSFELDWDIFTHPSGGHRVEPLVGGGVEVGVAEGVSVLALGELGGDWRLPPGAPGQTRLGYAVRIGLGFRLF